MSKQPQPTVQPAAVQPAARKLVYYVATTIDHYIAHEDESIDGFIMEGQHTTDFLSSLTEFDTILMGKKTYEWGYRYGAQPGQPAYPHANLMNYVFSQTMEHFQHERLQVVSDDPAAFVRQLKGQQGKPIWLCGGGSLAGYLLDHELIDELTLKLHPVAFGGGIALFGNSRKGFALCLNHTKLYSNGVMYLNYTIRYA